MAEPVGRSPFGVVVGAGIVALGVLVLVFAIAATSGGMSHASALVFQSCRTLAHVVSAGVALVLASIPIGAVVLSLAWVIAARRRTVRVMRAFVRVDADGDRRVRAAARACSLDGRVETVRCDVPLALTYGLLHPRVAVSAGTLAVLDDAELLAVIAHESKHVRDRDPLRALLSDAVVAATPMFPVVGRLRDRERVASELAADGVAIAHAGRPALARALHRFLSAPVPPAPACGVTGMGDLDVRLAGLVGEHSPPRPRMLGAITASLASAVTLLGVGLLLHGTVPMH